MVLGIYQGRCGADAGLDLVWLSSRLFIAVRYIPLDISYACFFQSIHSLAVWPSVAIEHLLCSPACVLCVLGPCGLYHDGYNDHWGLDGYGERVVRDEHGYDLILRICVGMTNVTCILQASFVVLYMLVVRLAVPASLSLLHPSTQGRQGCLSRVSSSRQAWAEGAVDPRDPNSGLGQVEAVDLHGTYVGWDVMQC